MISSLRTVRLTNRSDVRVCVCAWVHARVCMPWFIILALNELYHNSHTSREFLGSYLHLSKGKLCDGSWSSLGCEVRILTRTAHRLFSRPFLPFLVVEGIARWRLNMDLLTRQEQCSQNIFDRWAMSLYCWRPDLNFNYWNHTSSIRASCAAQRARSLSIRVRVCIRDSIFRAHGVESRARLYTASV